MSFRTRVLLAIVAVVTLVTGTALRVAQQTMEASSARAFRVRFDHDVRALRSVRAARLEAVEARCFELAHSVRLLAAMEEGEPRLLYQIALDELLDVVSPPPGLATARRATFVRLLDGDGRVIPPADARLGLVDPGADDAAWERHLSRAARALDAARPQSVGMVATGDVVNEVVLTSIVDRAAGHRAGALALGFAVDDPAEIGLIHGGVWVGRHLYAPWLAGAPRRMLEALGTDERRDETIVDVAGEPYRWFVRRLESGPGFPEARLVGLYPLAEALAARDDMRRRLALAALLALVVGVVLARSIARALARPIDALVAAAARVRAGDYGTTVPARGGGEIARLAGAFNDMTLGLAQRDRYRRLLDMVADPEIAERLVRGEVTLGGEMRRVTVLFCDLCDFTVLSRTMAAPDVVALLNLHMDAMTGVVHRHGGVVDKFVGDAIMAIFGAPTGHPDDALRAVRAARAMLAERARLDRAGGRALAVRVGIATGDAVVGCMGAAHRLDYTVVGSHVNLAARLCALAGRGEIMLDAATAAAAADAGGLVALPPASVKGFDDPVPVYRADAEPRAS